MPRRHLSVSARLVANPIVKGTQVPDLIQLGVVGCGRISQAAHLPAVVKAEGVALRAVCDNSPVLAEAMGARYGVPAHTRLEDLLVDDVDAVVIAIPDRFHANAARQALLAGKHVLVEKPIAATIEQAEQLRDLAQASGLALQVASMKRFDPGVQFAAGAVVALGPIRSITGWYRVMSGLRAPVEATHFPPLVVDPAVQVGELEYKAAHREEHLLATHGIHTFDLLRYLVGPYEVRAAVLSRNERDFSWHAVGMHGGGGALSIEVTASVHAEWSEGFDIYGDRGHIGLRCPFPFTRQASTVRVFDEDGSRYTVPVFGDSDPYERQLEAFARAIASGGTAEPDAQDGIHALRVVEAIRAAVEAGGAA